MLSLSFGVYCFLTCYKLCIIINDQLFIPRMHALSTPPRRLCFSSLVCLSVCFPVSNITKNTHLPPGQLSSQKAVGPGISTHHPPGQLSSQKAVGPGHKHPSSPRPAELKCVTVHSDLSQNAEKPGTISLFFFFFFFFFFFLWRKMA